MFGFGRKKAPRADAKKATSDGVADTFVGATGGGWGEPPMSAAADGGEHSDYVGTMLERAKAYAEENGIGIGEEFRFTITDIPTGIASPHEIVFGMMMRASDFGFIPGMMMNETISLTRIEGTLSPTTVEGKQPPVRGAVLLHLHGKEQVHLTQEVKKPKQQK